MSTSKSPNNSMANATIHDVWLRQRAELEDELLNVGQGSRVPQTTTVAPVELTSKVSVLPGMFGNIPFAEQQPSAPVNTPAAQAKLQQSLNAVAAKQFLEHQQQLDQELSQQREAFLQEMSRQRAAFEQELAARDADWTAKRDREWAALQSAKEVHAVTIQKLQSELATERVFEHDGLHHWRRQAEAELTEARRLFEQDRMQQQSELARQRETELDRLRQERAEFAAQMRQSKMELAEARQRQDQDLRLATDEHASRMQSERAECEQLREIWAEKFRREQLVLENGLHFFEQYLSRFNQDLKSAQQNIQASGVALVPRFSPEIAMTGGLTPPRSPILSHTGREATSMPTDQGHDAEPVLLSLDEIRERLNQIKSHERQKVA